MSAFNDKARRLARIRSQKRGAESLKTMFALCAAPFVIFYWIVKICIWPFTLFFKKR